MTDLLRFDVCSNKGKDSVSSHGHVGEVGHHGGEPVACVPVEQVPMLGISLPSLHQHLDNNNIDNISAFHLDQLLVISLLLHLVVVAVIMTSQSVIGNLIKLRTHTGRCVNVDVDVEIYIKGYLEVTLRFRNMPILSVSLPSTKLSVSFSQAFGGIQNIALTFTF